MNHKWIIPSVLTLATFAFYLYSQRAHPLIGEEFMLFIQGERIINGEVPYRDFFQFITPGSIYIAGLLFKIFGIKLSVMKVYIALTGSVIVMLTYLLSIKIIANRYLSLLPVFLVIFYSIPQAPLFYHHWNAEVFILFTALFALCYIKEGSWLKLFISGACAGLAFLFLQHKGILILSALIIFLFIDALINKKSSGTSLVVTFSGFLLPLIPFFIYLFLNGATGRFLYNCFYWVVDSYSPFNSLPEYLYFEKRTFFHYLQTEGVIPALIKTRHYLFIGYLPIFILIYGIIELIKNFNKNILYIYLSSLFLFLSVLQRPDFINIIYVCQIHFILLGYYMQKFFDKNSIKSLAGYLILGLLMFNILYGCLTSIRNISALKYPLKTERGIIYFRSMNEMKEYSEIFSLLEGELKNKRIFVYNWSTFLYFLTGKKNYTSYDSFLPAYNTEEQMQELIDELKNEKIDYIIYDQLDLWLKINGENSLYPYGSKKIELNNELNKYINSHYSKIREAGEFIILKLN